MRQATTSWAPASALALALVVAPLPSWAQEAEPSAADDGALTAGRRIYDQTCAYCHGAEGRGDGPVALFLARDMAPRPRDFTSEPFKFRSTPSGELPTDEDLMRIVTEGRPGLMPGFWALSLEERRQVIAYVKSLVPDFTAGVAVPEPLEIGPHPPASARSVALGETVYAKLQCAKCHGDGGEGDGPSAATLQTTNGLAILPVDLTRPSSFGGGDDPEDVYRTFMTGMNGVPMPSYAGVISEEEAWALVDFVLSLDREGL